MKRGIDRIVGRAGWIALIAAPIAFAIVVHFRVSSSPSDTAATPRSTEPPPPAPAAMLDRPRPPAPAPVLVQPSHVADRPPPDAGDRVDEALAATDLDARMRLLRDALLADPTNTRALAGMTDLLSQRHADLEAHAYAQRCLQVDSARLDCATVLVRSDIRQHQYEAGREEVDDCLRIEPHAPECVASLGRLRLAAGDVDGAGQTIRILDSLGPQSPDTELDMGEIARAQGHEDAAHAHLDNACRAGLSNACALLDAPAHVGAE